MIYNAEILNKMYIYSRILLHSVAVYEFFTLYIVLAVYHHILSKAALDLIDCFLWEYYPCVVCYIL